VNAKNGHEVPGAEGSDAIAIDQMKETGHRENDGIVPIIAAVMTVRSLVKKELQVRTVSSPRIPAPA